MCDGSLTQTHAELWPKKAKGAQPLRTLSYFTIIGWVLLLLNRTDRCEWMVCCSAVTESN